MKNVQLPENVERLEKDQPFAFACHRDVPCFTHCCRHLELALTPYDALRLKNALQLHSSQFLERYVIIEQERDDIFPRLYLTMIDDGEASCVFVNASGCTVYRNRPGACRAYPLGRAAMRGTENQIEQFFVVLRESHCRGFLETREQTALQYINDQGLQSYNRFNDALIEILQHEVVRRGKRLSQSQIDEFILGLYDLDGYRETLYSGRISDVTLTDEKKKELADDEKLLFFAIQWLKKRLFSQP